MQTVQTYIKFKRNIMFVALISRMSDCPLTTIKMQYYKSDVVHTGSNGFYVRDEGVQPNHPCSAPS